MTERYDGRDDPLISDPLIRDPLIRERLRAALGEAPPPAWLTTRVERLARAGVEPLPAPVVRPALVWGELMGPLAGVALLLALLGGAVIHLLLPGLAPGPAASTGGFPSAALLGLLMPAVLLLLVELMRGGPTLRRWVQ